MTSSETIFHGIELIPSYAQVLITSTGRIKLLEDKVEPPAEHYQDGLRDYIAVWRSRLATLLLDDRVHLSTDVTGGVDSRTVLAFLASLRDVANPNDRFRFASATSRHKDFAAASNIANHYGFQLNQKQTHRPKINQDSGFQSWFDNSLGVYLLVYLDGKSLDPFMVQAHGAGGGNFRPIHKGTDMGARLSKYEQALPAGLYRQWRNSVLDTMGRLTSRSKYTNPMVLHYREFRNRFHFGHKPHRNVVYTPLNSVLTDPLTDGPSGVSPQQFYFDVMESLAPGLKDFPYDNANKMPKNHHNTSIFRASISPPNPGQIFASTSSFNISNDSSNGPDAYSRWISTTRDAMDAESVADFIEAPLYDRARAGLDRALLGERLAANSREIMDLSFVLSVYFAYEGWGASL